MRHPTVLLTGLLLALLLLLPTVASPAFAAGAPSRTMTVGFTEVPLAARGIGVPFAGGRIASVDLALGAVTIDAANPRLVDLLARMDPRVRYVEEMGVATSQMTPNDPRLAEQYALANLGAGAAWDVTVGKGSVKLCLIDTGARLTHEDLAGRIVGGHDFVSNDATPQDGHGHGTHVATIAAGTSNNGRGIAGVAQVSILVARVLDNNARGTYDKIASGIRWCADQGAAVISMSLGGTTASTLLSDAVAYAAGRGALLVAAAGNSGPCSSCILYPARYAEVIAVGCTTSARAVCSYSSRGPELDLVAPGNAVLAGWATTDATYRTSSGTSMAAPHVAGVAALVKSAEPGLGKEGLRARLLATARDLGATGHDASYGAGEVDAAAALGRSGGTPPPPPPPPPTTVTLLSEGFEGAAAGWTTTGLWHATSACVTAPEGGRTMAWTNEPACTFATGSRTSGVAAAPTVSLAGRQQATLHVVHWWQVESYASGSYDQLRIQASRDGVAWTTLKLVDSRTARPASFVTESLDLGAYAGGTVHVRFFADSMDATANSYRGWFVDAVRITAA